MKWKNLLWTGVSLLLLFVFWTILIQTIDVRMVGPKDARVGFASWNTWFHKQTGVNMTLYTVTDWLGLLPVLICGCFGLLGLWQWIHRKKILQVDHDILFLGVYYLLVIVGYLLFEMVPINYRPVLIEGYLEASYPSSTTLLVLSVMPTLKFQTDRRCKKRVFRSLMTILTILFSLFMAAGRLLSGVHWVTDIIGSVFLSNGLFLLYAAMVNRADQKKTATVPWGKNYGIS